MQDRFLLFVYSSLLRGETEHSRLHGAEFVAEASTTSKYHLFEVGPYGALVEGGATSVRGEVYRIDRELRRQLDVHREIGVLFDRKPIELALDLAADAYVMPSLRVRGKRRLHGGDWKARFGGDPGGFGRGRRFR